MKIFPSKEEFLRLAQKGNLIPVYSDLMADFETPVSVYSKLNRTGPAFLLESIEGGANLFRYSIIGCQPRKILNIYLDHTELIDRNGQITQIKTPADPLTVVEKEMRDYRPVAIEGMPRFIGGAVGFLGYEYIHCIEPTVPPAECDPHNMPILHFMITDTVVIFDRAKQTLRLLINAHIEDDAASAYATAIAGIENLYTTLQQERRLAPIPLSDPGKIALPPSNFRKQEFENLVLRSKEYIVEGDIIQAVLSQRFEEPFSHSPLDLYRTLRTVNPSPYMFLYEAAEFALVGASPEVHVRLTDGRAETRPIAGTRPRGNSSKEDLDYEEDLLSDDKERAEHLMLVDLSRNDLGRVCEFGSVTVPEYMVVERYSHVMHIVSQVEGRLSLGRTAYDLMRATFPAGTVSGAPKIRAMQIISELERQQRGPYAGAVSYFSYDGNLDSCIALRTALLKDNTVYIQSGAGLVADSEPYLEFQETLNKAKAMFSAVKMAKKLDS
ncbi:MAG: Anthranilate synthase component 1 [Candidatus Moanabacter tarae]|uniref:Anthranilate synthase component 1 n=1 Tax=Candidatus Moanibacter tarae TaxID=2200854 RepID=A0A2Z4AHW1_9BACT|nr:MAG: Anthranilate synthase component 1 [Candidatus Moanabacter tarae]|tara:strand:- start:22760 stop:24247 length:1488 start_codon:yes stop_codon:yes gene_type:complete